MKTKRTTRHSCNYTAPVSTLVRGRDDYNTYTHYAGLAMFAMFMVLALGSVVLGW